MYACALGVYVCVSVWSKAEVVGSLFRLQAFPLTKFPLTKFPLTNIDIHSFI